MEKIIDNLMEEGKLLEDTSNKITSNISHLATDISMLEKDTFEPIDYLDIQKEESIFEVFKTNDYRETVSNILNAINN